MVSPEITGSSGAKKQFRSRGAVACRRCRRLRTKCVTATINAACDGCKNAGQPCVYVSRGQNAYQDRNWRAFPNRPMTPTSNPRASSSHSCGLDTDDAGTLVTTAESETMAAAASLTEDNHYASKVSSILPPIEEITGACNIFLKSYFQLGFIPKASFADRLSKNQIGEFLICSILALSARFTPALVKRYGNSTAATSYFLSLAHRCVPEVLYEVCLENTQGFFLLSIADWGNCDKEKSSIHMGIAVRMAATLRLHREETYNEKDKSDDEIMQSEVARRTFWMIQSQDNLQSGYQAPAPFSLDDITVLLPSDESDFLFGIMPVERAALRGTPPAKSDPRLADSPKRSLFATLVQAHNIWGQIARTASSSSYESFALDPSIVTDSEYIRTVRILEQFETNLPQQHRWSEKNLRVWYDLGFDLAYLSIVMMLQLSNIICRRLYLGCVESALQNVDTDESTRLFWTDISLQLFRAVHILHEQIQAAFALRSRSERQAFPAILVLPVYVCGSLALNLCKSPQLCPEMADTAPSILQNCLNTISQLQGAWPMARSWRIGLQQAASPLSPAPQSPSNVPLRNSGSIRDHYVVEEMETSNLHQSITCSLSGQSDLFGRNENDQTQQVGSLNVDSLSEDVFDAQVMAFLQGDANFGHWNCVP